MSNFLFNILVFIHMHQYAFICIRHASVYTHMPPYALFTHRNSNIQCNFPPTSRKVQQKKTQNMYRYQERTIGPNPTRINKLGKHVCQTRIFSYSNSVHIRFGILSLLWLPSWPLGGYAAVPQVKTTEEATITS